ncbi:MAG: Efflux transporter, family, subunit [Verrucomicrobiales bacterium]|nr:Efflux transporter, family, subunit [Verrucomicrobiales bacterium]
MKKLIIVVVVLAVGYGAFYEWQKYQAQQRIAKAPKRQTTATLEERDIEFAVQAAGDIGPADQVSVRPEINGRIDQLPVDIGDTVKRGDALFTLNDSDLQKERAQRLTEIEGAKLQVKKAERNYERSKQLFASKLVSQEVFDDAKTDFDLSSNSLEKAEKSLGIIEEQLTKTKILAPFDCTVLTRPVSIGQAVSGSGGFNSGTEVMTIANLNDMIISAHINQADVTRLKPKQHVDIEIDSVPGLKMTGTIERIAPQATIKNNLKGFDARIAIKDIDIRARPGMTANLSIPVISEKNVLAAPIAAVFTEKGERFAYVKKDQSFERRIIQIGVSDLNFVEVTEGLTVGEVVSLEPPDSFEEKGKPAGDKKPGTRKSKPVKAASAK